MEKYIQAPEVRWSDLDPNFHLRHSVYYDYGAYCRINYLTANGLTAGYLIENHIGPIIFREECLFKREIKAGDRITIDLQLIKSRPDGSRWSIRHNIFKNGDELAAILTVDGAWMDTIKRKLAIPPSFVAEVFHAMPQSADYELLK